MGEAKRRAAASPDYVFVEVDPGSPTAGFEIPEVEAGVMLMQIGTRGRLTEQHCRAMADVLSRGVDRQPDAIVMATVGGFEADPREVLDIPEARAAFRHFGGRLRELDEKTGQPRLLNRLDSITRALVLAALELVPDRIIEFVDHDDPILKTQADADRDHFDRMKRRFEAAAAMEADRNRKQ